MKISLSRLYPPVKRKSNRPQSTIDTATAVRQQYEEWKLTLDYLNVGGVRTAVHTATFRPGRPTVVFVHGIGGDYHGMVPLAYLLRDKYNLVFIDLPGHGKSAIPLRRTLSSLERWSRRLPEVLDYKMDMVVSHSFGCFSAQYMNAPMTVYINPPLSLTKAVLDYSLKLYSVRYLASLVYNIRPYALWRGHRLIRHQGRRIEARVAWVTDSSITSRGQFLYQARLARLATDGRKLMRRELIERLGSSFVISKYDKVADMSPEQSAWLRGLPLLQLPDDHLSILESPEEIADMINQQFIDNNL